MSEDQPEITIRHHVVGQGGKYVAQITDNPHHGMLEWEPGDGPDIHIAVHTVVPKEIGGRGIAALLVERMVGDARTHGFRIEPRCSYVAAKFEEHPEWADLRA